MRSFAVAILCVEILAATMLTRSSSRPIPAEEIREERSPSVQTPAEDDFFGIPGLVITTNSHLPVSCKVVIPVKRNQTVWTLSAKGVLQSSLQEVTQYVTSCCEGWTGTECDVAPPTIPPPPSTAAAILDPSNPCANLTCAGVENALCAVVTKCGRHIPVFIDPSGQLVDCPDSPTSVQDVLCNATCRDDPCARNVSCPRYPEAMCFTSECECKAMWLLPSGVEVKNCSADTRDTRRDANDETRCSQQL